MSDAEELVALRESYGWSKRDLSRHLGCNPSMVTRWESGATGISAYYKKRIAELDSFEDGLLLKDLIMIWSALEEMRDIRTRNPNQRGPRNRRITSAQVKIRAMIKEKGL